jgi:hypothetical protein
MDAIDVVMTTGKIKAPDTSGENRRIDWKYIGR